jgi:drug/metabolite transporter, DME family
MRTMDDRQLAIVAVLMAACLFGTTGTVLQRGPDGAGALGAGAVRLLIGGLTLCAVARIERPLVPRPWKQMRGTVLGGGIAVAVYQLCFFEATTRTGVALGTVVTIGSGPVFSGAIAAYRTRRPPSAAWCVGTALSIVGVVLLGLVGSATDVDVLGISAALLSGLGWAVYATIGRHQIERGLDSTASMASMFTMAAVLVSPLLFTQDMGWIGTPSGAAMALYLGVMTVGVAYTLYGRGLRKLDAPTVITLTLAEPITAAVLSVVVLGETIAVAGWMGIALVLAGLVVTARGATGAPILTSEPPSPHWSTT